MLEREHRSRIFEKILKDMEDESNGVKKAKPQQTKKPAGIEPDELNSIRIKAERAAKHGDHATAAQEFERALKVAILNSSSNAIGLIELHLAHGANLQRCGEFAKAKEAFDKAQDVLEEGASISMSEQQVKIEAARGLLSFVLEDYQSAEGHYTKAIETYETSCTVKAVKLAKLRSDLGSVFAQTSQFDKALEIVLEAIAVLEHAPESTAEENMRLFKQLANITFRKNEPNAAVNHLLEAYRHAQQVDCPTEMVELEVTLATVYTQHGEFETAKQWYEAAISRQEKMENSARWPLSLLYSSLALVQSYMDESQSAVDCFSRSLDLQLSHLAVQTPAN